MCVCTKTTTTRKSFLVAHIWVDYGLSPGVVVFVWWGRGFLLWNFFSSIFFLSPLMMTITNLLPFSPPKSSESFFFLPFFFTILEKREEDG